MISSNVMRAAVMTAVALGFAAAAAQADECEAMTKSVKGLIEKSDPAKSADNPAALCAAYAEGPELIKSFRVVVDGCLDEGDNRTLTLSAPDPSLRHFQSQAD